MTPEVIEKVDKLMYMNYEMCSLKKWIEVSEGMWTRPYSNGSAIKLAIVTLSNVPILTVCGVENVYRVE